MICYTNNYGQGASELCYVKPPCMWLKGGARAPCAPPPKSAPVMHAYTLDATLTMLPNGSCNNQHVPLANATIDMSP